MHPMHPGLFALLAATWWMPCPGQAETLLRWKLQSGQVLRADFQQNTIAKTTGAGRPTEMSIDMRMRMTWRIESLEENGTARMSQRFDWLQVRMTPGSGEAIEFDSAKETENADATAELAVAIKPLLGVDFSVTMSDRGVIEDVTLPDEVADAIAKTGNTALTQLFSKEGITRTLRQSAVEFPERAVSEGEQWTRPLQTQSPLGLLKQELTFTLAGDEELDGKPVVRIMVRAEQQLDQAESPAKVAVMDAGGDGSLLFDVPRGLLVRGEFKQRLTTERPYREFKIRVETTSSSTTMLSDASEDAARP